MPVLWFGAGVVFALVCVMLTTSVHATESLTVPHDHASPLPDWVHTLAEYGRRPHTRSRLRELAARVVSRYLDDVATWVMSSITDPGFTEWWEQTCTNERKRTYHGRRRYEEVSKRREWRERWAEWNTQPWPTLSTSGHAWHLVPTMSESEKMLIICTGMTFNTTTQVMPVEHVARNLSENPRLLHSVA